MGISDYAVGILALSIFLLAMGYPLPAIILSAIIIAGVAIGSLIEVEGAK